MNIVKTPTKRQEIIQEAFKVWGENSFYNTSLASLAQSMNISKAALYRHIKGKEDLLEAMKEYFLQLHRHLCQEVQQKAAGKGFDEKLSIFHKVVIQFYAKNYWYYRFIFIHMASQSEESLDSFKELKQFQKELFPLEELHTEFGWDTKELVLVQNYILNSGIFLLFHSSMSQFSFEKLKKSDLKNLNKSIVTEGFAGQERLNEIDFQRIEDQCWLDSCELPETDRIFSAIAQVVGEVGLWEASLEKIAGKAGISKSSLYFYFKNRNDMIWEMIDRERHSLGQLFLQKSGIYESFEERLYAYFVVFSSYMWARSNILEVMNWFRFQGFKIEVPANCTDTMVRYVQFLNDGQELDKLRKDLFGPQMIIQWINQFLIQEIHNINGNKLLTKESNEMLRTLYRLFLFGVKGE